MIIGESGSGKDSIVDSLCHTYNLTKVKSYTTRKPRFVNEDTHTFIGQKEAADLKNIIAETNFNGNYYCATQEQVDNADFYIIDKSGIEYFKEHYQSSRLFKIIYITVPSFLRRSRMKSRGDTEEMIEQRIANDDKLFDGVDNMADFIKININLSESKEDVWNYICSCEKTKEE